MVSNGEFDRVMDAFCHRYRRRLLAALLDENPQDDDDFQDAEDALGIVAGGTDDTELLETKLVHNHLPKLEAMEYIEWDRETGEISTGPNWAEVEPFLVLLQNHADELPDGWL